MQPHVYCGRLSSSSQAILDPLSLQEKTEPLSPNCIPQPGNTCTVIPHRVGLSPGQNVPPRSNAFERAAGCAPGWELRGCNRHQLWALSIAALGLPTRTRHDPGVQSVFRSSVSGGTTTDNRQPVTKDNEPVIGDNEPVIGDNEPVIGDNEPVIGDNEPVIGDNEPVIGDNEPVIGDNEPVIGDNEPVIGDNEPVIGDNEPVVGDNEPVVGDNKPISTVNRWTG